MQITHRDSGYDWQKCNEKFCMPKMTYKVMTKIEYVNSEKRFFESGKNGFKKHLPALCPRDFFYFRVGIIKK